MTLAERNMRIIELVRSGKTYAEAAREVGVSKNTVAGVLYRDRRRNEVMPNLVVPVIHEPTFLRRVIDRILGKGE